MNFIWPKNREEENVRYNFTLQTDGACDTLTVCAADSYQIFLDGKFVRFGPKRTAEGFARPDTLPLNGAKQIEVRVSGYNINCYSVDRQLPYFAAEVKKGESVLFTSEHFTCTKSNARLQKMPRYSRQRGFVEGYDFTKTGEQTVETCAVQAPKLIEEVKDYCDYAVLPFQTLKKGEFQGFAGIGRAWWENHREFGHKEGYFHAIKDFAEEVANGYLFYDFTLEKEHTGFISLDIEAEEETKVFAVFEEYMPDGKWNFRRSQCNDFIVLTVPKGKTAYLTEEPYAFKYLKILSNKPVRVTPALVRLENVHADCVSVSGDGALVNVFEAAKNTFCQNAIDIFMDCPGRERAGWLCDSYFTAKSELLFTGKNDIERAFLQNYMIAVTPEHDARMVPMCFPSDHSDGGYIANWALWLCLEVCDYFKRSGDKTIPDTAREKLYGIIDFYCDYLCAEGFVENMGAWNFVEWSICNSPEYIKGVNFPTNMLFAYAMKEVGALYGDNALIKRGEELQRKVVDFAYNGTFFIENAVHEEGKLVLTGNLSETCQYYALFTGICPDEAFKKRMINEFGPLHKEDGYPTVGRSNMFIGNYLRFFWLCEEGEYERVLSESVNYFDEMVQKTGTLWEHDLPSASCNHGFASVFAVLMLRCMCGYQTTKNGKPVCKEGNFAKNYQLNVKFDYKD